MKKYGIENVRGGSFCSIILTEYKINKLKKIISYLKDDNIDYIECVNLMLVGKKIFDDNNFESLKHLLPPNYNFH